MMIVMSNKSLICKFFNKFTRQHINSNKKLNIKRINKKNNHSMTKITSPISMIWVLKKWVNQSYPTNHKICLLVTNKTPQVKKVLNQNLIKKITSLKKSKVHQNHLKRMNEKLICNLLRNINLRITTTSHNLMKWKMKK